jgi:alkanesulfonate monooxygenase SsuD/methylene tetrahydromethanopterin reductase-like flavin-dependent oxidoreductase (luciferase family)
MQVSYFETGRYHAPASNLPRQWPMPADAYDRAAGLRAFQGMVERSRFAEELGYDWVSVSEHHYSPRILTPSLPIAAAYIASQVRKIKIALLGPIVPQSNPVLLAEEMAMLDNMAEGRLIVGLLRGTTNEMLTYDLNPEESRERTDEGMELILKAWKESQPFGWQGRHFHYRTVSVWPRPLQEPLPPVYALGTSQEASDFAARHHVGLGVSFGPFDAMGKVTAYYREQCARHDWQPEPHEIIYRANIVIAETDGKAQQAMERYPRQAVFQLNEGVAAALLELDQRTVAGQGRRPANVNRALPINFCGGPDQIIAQLKDAREQIGCGIVDLSFQTPGSEDPDDLMQTLQLFGTKVLPHIRDI